MGATEVREPLQPLVFFLLLNKTFFSHFFPPFGLFHLRQLQAMFTFLVISMKTWDVTEET